MTDDDLYRGVEHVRNIPFNNVNDSYWFVGDQENQVYSSKRRQMVPIADEEFVEWKKWRAVPRADNVEDLRKWLATMGVGDGDREHNSRE